LDEPQVQNKKDITAFRLFSIPLANRRDSHESIRISQGQSLHHACNKPSLQELLLFLAEFTGFCAA